MYEPETIKVEFGNGRLLRKGGYAIFYKELRHGTQKAVNVLTRPFLKYPDGQAPRLTLKEGETPKIEGATSVEVDMGKVDWDLVNDSIIVGQVKEWSFGEVDMETLDGLPDTIREKLKAECDRLYGSNGPLPEGGGAS